ncbi:LysM peptidoglycan-binding domain-containing protein [Nocardioides aquaticus]|uniref:LysM peptidoglycan-binding domain-containing protein n=1 Tax=Nocardioides aquaticus TaxID=160826 RepID=UPI001BD4BAD7|nr:LysM peptidoglycan-binding domain-containing protein [Nocardioides aquaticus]
MTAIRRAGILLRGLSSAVILVVLAVGVPAMLLGTVGNPIPDEWTWTSPLTTGALLGLIACVAWVFWVQLVICVVVELIAEVRLATGRSADWLARVPGTFGGQQALARSLVQAVIAIGLTTTATGTTTSWIGHADAATPAPAGTPAVTTQMSSNAAAPASAARRSTISVTVERGDTLWSIAEQHLGAGERWREIAELNRGREMTDGSTFDDARTILPGWELLVPSVAPRDVVVDRAVTVKQGDTLWELAEESYGEGSAWPRIYEANAEQIEDPARIFPGQRFVVPDQPAKEPPAVEHVQPPVEPPDTEVVPPAKSDPPAAEESPTSAPTSAPADVAPSSAAETDNQTTVGSGGVLEDSGFHVDGATITRALLGGGGFLAAGMLAVYVGRRRTQTRNRRSGRAMPSVAPPLRADDKVLRAIGNEAGQRVAFFDSALRELAQLIESSGLRLPDAAAARIDQERLELQLAHPELAAPDPWIASPDGSVWTVSAGHTPATWDRISPYPAMVTLGNDADGGTWLLDLESAGVTQIVGAPAAAADLARFVAAELALNPWSDAEIVSVAGIAGEVAPLNYGRIFAEPRLDIDRLTKLARQVADTVESSGRHVLASRVADGEDAWVPTVAIGRVGDQDGDVSKYAIADLLNEVERTSARTSVALLIVATEAVDARALTLRLTGEGSLETPWGTVRPNRLTGEEAAILAELFADADTEGDEPIPGMTGPGAEPTGTDEAGALVQELTVPRRGTGDPHSVLPRPDRAYVEAAATTADDLAALAPEVPPSEVASHLAGTRRSRLIWPTGSIRQSADPSSESWDRSSSSRAVRRPKRSSRGRRTSPNSLPTSPPIQPDEHRTRWRPTSGSRTTPCTPVWVSSGSGSAGSPPLTSGTCPTPCGYGASRFTGSRASSWTPISSGGFEHAVRPEARKGSRTCAVHWSW